MAKRGRMIFDLPDDEREALERIRIARGLRSHAEALRSLIRNADGELWDQTNAAMSAANPLQSPRPIDRKFPPHDSKVKLDLPEDYAEAQPRKAVSAKLTKDVAGAMREGVDRASAASAPLLQRKAFNPQPKKGKTK